jgi:hypothetical protein
MTADEQKLIAIVRNSTNPVEMLVLLNKFTSDFLERLPTYQKTMSAVPQESD